MSYAAMMMWLCDLYVSLQIKIKRSLLPPVRPGQIFLFLFLFLFLFFIFIFIFGIFHAVRLGIVSFVQFN